MKDDLMLIGEIADFFAFPKKQFVYMRKKGLLSQ